VPTAYLFEILDTAVYPNPYNTDKGSFRIVMNMTRPVNSLTLKVYTTGFRKVLEYTDPTVVPAAGARQITLPASKFAGFAGGTYYYRLEGTSSQGEKAYSAGQKFLIIRYK
jgi:hypothetical protein